MSAPYPGGTIVAPPLGMEVLGLGWGPWDLVMDRSGPEDGWPFIVDGPAVTFPCQHATIPPAPCVVAPAAIPAIIPVVTAAPAPPPTGPVILARRR